MISNANYGMSLLLPNRNYKFNWLFLKRIFRIHKIIFSQPSNVLLLLFLLLVCGAEQVLGYKTGLVAGGFYEVLLNKDMSGFQKQVLRSLAFITGIALTMTLRIYVSNILTLWFRKTLTRRLHESYFEKNEYYRINVLIPRQTIDNPDQRIAADIDSFSRSYGSMIPRLITSPFIIAYYSWDAYTRAGYVGPTGTYAFFLVGTLINLFLMSPVSRKVFQLEKREGDFRYKHVFIRDRAEELASMNASRLEYKNTSEKFDRLLAAQQSLYNQEAFLDLSTNLFNYVGAILSYLIIAVPIFMGVYDYMDKATLGKQISQNSFVCMTLIYDFTQVIDLAFNVASMSGVTHRIIELLELMDNKCEDSSQLDCLDYDLKSHSTDEKKDSFVVILMNNITLTPPLSDRILIENLELAMMKGQRLLITGPSGSGKSSLLRHIRGLWKARVGRTLVKAKNMFYLPQKPLFTDGSLMDNMIYPSESNPNVDDHWFIEQLLALELNHLLERYSMSVDKCNWSDILSPGEMQRICFIRIFYHLPDLILLDEATSSLSPMAEKALYEKTLETFSNATIISVGHRESLRDYHDLELTLTSRREWVLSEIDHSETLSVSLSETADT